MPNKGKICISVAAPTASEVIDKIARAGSLADVIEIRFDALAEAEIKALVEKLASIPTPLLITYRPREQGGYRDLSFAERIKFWEFVIPDLGARDFLVDHELDVDFALQLNPSQVILSMHDFKGGGESLSPDAFLELNAGTIKIAVTVLDAAEAVHVWNLLRDINKPFIPIAMGEAGRWTRILGLAYGAPITYAAPDDGLGTAPGQISAKDLIEVFRVKELDGDTQIFGVVAGDTSYSLSPFMQNAGFKAAGLNSVFVPFQVADLGAFVQRMIRTGTREVELNFQGLSITNPHKQAIIRYLDEIDPIAESIGAVNTVKIDGDRLVGFNTDVDGFLAPLERKLIDLKGSRVSVIGAGGAARACIYALKRAGSSVTVFARDDAKASALAREFDIHAQQLGTEDRKPIAADILVNATPLGTRGSQETETVATADKLRDVKLVYDLVYNPTETRLINEAKAAGVDTLGGLDMLVAQGAKQFEIWTGQAAPVAAMRTALEKRLQ